ncbi:MAG TPA: hypothetical protein VFU19_17750 [Iamia sp.]|nr:hypothetical protein [Iamia sp.]
MVLTERNRNVLYQGLTRTIGDEEAVEAMLSQFPAREADEPATKDFVRAEIAEVRNEIAGLRGEMIQGFADIKDYVHSEMRLWVRWHFASMFVLLAAVVAAARLIG